MAHIYVNCVIKEQFLQLRYYRKITMHAFLKFQGKKIAGLQVIKLFSCSTQPSTKFILLINVKMPTIIGILTFISLINTTPERLKARNFFICWYFSFYQHLKIHDQLSRAQNKVDNLRA